MRALAPIDTTPMKKPDLEKFLAGKIAGRMKQEPHSDRYGTASGHVFDKKEQREREKAAGLVPYAVKLPQDLVTALQTRARERGVSLNDLSAELLREGLGPKAVGAPKAARPAHPAGEPESPPRKPAVAARTSKAPKTVKTPAKAKKS